MKLTYVTATAEDFDELVELRIDAMKEGLEAIGRFDRDRSIQRFKSSFRPDETEIIKNEQETIGFLAVSEKEDHLYLDHLYISPKHQSCGFGSLAIKEIIRRSELKNLPLRLGALRSSRSNDFYRSHGFVVRSEDDYDIYYERENRELRTSITTSEPVPPAS